MGAYRCLRRRASFCWRNSRRSWCPRYYFLDREGWSPQDPGYSWHSLYPRHWRWRRWYGSRSQEERMGQLEVRQFSKMKGRSHRLVADWEVISLQLGEASLSRSDPLRLELPVVVHVSEHD